MFINTRFNPCVLGLAATLGFASLPALADFEVSGSVTIRAKADFDVPLAAHGTWVSVGSYGRCWRPAHVAVGWRPYVRGEWVWTDCGWYWSSDEPWGWACYHYGYWVVDPAVGWVWVPHTKWAPAWVSWRVGGGYIGWAPLPPAGIIFAGRPHADAFVFVGEARFGGPVRSSVLVVNNSAIFAKTTVIGGIKQESHAFGTSSQKVMVNHGPRIDMVQKSTGRSFAAVPINQAVTRSTGDPRAKRLASAERGGRDRAVADVQPERGGREKVVAEATAEHGYSAQNLNTKAQGNQNGSSDSRGSDGRDHGGRARGGGGHGHR